MVRSIVLQHNVSLVCLQVSKLAVFDLVAVKQCFDADFFGFAYSPAEANRGSIIVAQYILALILLDCSWRLMASPFILSMCIPPKTMMPGIYFLLSRAKPCRASFHLSPFHYRRRPGKGWYHLPTRFPASMRSYGTPPRP